MTYARYRSALEVIAEGAEDSVAIAKEALRSRAFVKSPERIDEERRIQSERIARGITKKNEREAGYFDCFKWWFENGRPTLKQVGLHFGISTERARQRLAKVMRLLSHPSRKNHPLRAAVEQVRREREKSEKDRLPKRWRYFIKDNVGNKREIITWLDGGGRPVPRLNGHAIAVTCQGDQGEVGCIRFDSLSDLRRHTTKREIKVTQDGR